MKEKKHIDRIFQEKLKDFEAIPNDAIWEHINAELHKEKRDRKIIPIWWKIAGVAASLLLLITIGNAVFNTSDSDSTPNEVVDTVDDSTKETQEKTTQDSQEEDTENEALINNLVPENDNQITSVKESKDGNTKPLDVITNGASNSKNKSHSYNQEDAVVSAHKTSENSNDNLLNTTDDNSKAANPTNAGIADQNPINNADKNSSKNAVADNISKNLPEQPTSKETASEGITPVPANTTSTTEGLAATDVSKEDEKEEHNNTTDKANPTIEEAIALSEDEEDINEKEKEVIDRWSVMPNVSPVYYNTLGKGSSIHNQFNNNSKSGQLNMSYGVNASYAISDKLSIRSGVNKVNVGYNTNDVVVYQSLNAQIGAFPTASTSTLRNIDIKESAQGISIISGENLAFSQVPEVVSQNLQSSLDQEISFIEVPVELEYKISEKKLGLSVIGGFSTMILNNNTIYTDVNEQRTLLGEANNINTISYSANLGVGLGIKVSEKIDLNFEPTFKYQIKTFNNTSGDFKPYIIGITSGLKFKF